MQTLFYPQALFKLTRCSLFALIILMPTLFYAHGVHYKELNQAKGFKIYYESGDVLKNAQVNIYSPRNIKMPWLITRTNDSGDFFFTPDRPGDWFIMITDGEGHGKRINLTIDQDVNLGIDSSSELSIIHKILIVVAVLWGFTGTALYFKARNKAIIQEDKK